MAPDIADAEPAAALPHVAFARCAPGEEALGCIGDIGDAAWLAACRRLTPRVERAGSAGALLDLGACSDHEAIDVLRAFHDRLHASGLRVRLGLGPTATLAQLALLTSPGRRALAHVPRDED